MGLRVIGSMPRRGVAGRLDDGDRLEGMALLIGIGSIPI